jgi:hypothetical protein
MISFKFKMHYNSVEEFKSDMHRQDGVSVMIQCWLAIVDHIDDEFSVIFDISEDGSVKFDRYEDQCFY